MSLFRYVALSFCRSFESLPLVYILQSSKYFQGAQYIIITLYGLFVSPPKNFIIVAYFNGLRNLIYEHVVPLQQEPSFSQELRHVSHNSCSSFVNIYNYYTLYTGNTIDNVQAGTGHLVITHYIDDHATVLGYVGQILLLYNLTGQITLKHTPQKLDWLDLILL